ncbi:MAG: hypothetical protein KJO41_08835 [Bacteroidia bacterium]|nr:hypothetical protein [Bacteroidia bacterium]MBT8279095.1 hypothetical protein [Bacteroidia bacterium]NND26016.1 hypothetical protein [Flavobacteriaceae bacterium]NNK60431.1 hypothetical protein [Flavobacteriaceae bacterium]NNL33128.1 hypothetical protein [Flavobacteriaceae bacterium]
MIKNKNLNYAIIVFAITLTCLFAFVEFYPIESIVEADVNSTEAIQSDNLTVISN